jgi:hypothetical protein
MKFLEQVTAQLCFAAAFPAHEGGKRVVESGEAALNNPISPLFGPEALLRRIAWVVANRKPESGGLLGDRSV